MRIIILPGGLELGAIGSNQGGEFTVRGAMPSGFAVVGFNQRDITDDQLGVIAIGQLDVERVGAGLAVRRVKGAFDDYGCCFGECFGAACGFDELVYDFLRVLRMCWLGKQDYAKDSDYCEIAS